MQYTLEPLVYEGPAEGKPKDQWRLKLAAELLALKICDMACGSGAFLVQVCIYLAERLLEAWDEAERRVEGSPRITPYGEVSKGLPDEQLIPLDRQERLIYARRLVAERCIYGVDKNPLAVEMAKLSLWLLTLAKDKPFTFLDHAIRCGDSLVGLSSINQLLRFSLTENAKVRPLMEQQRQQIEKRLEATMLLRKQIETLPSNTPQDIERKAKMFENVVDQTKRLTYAADMLLAVSWEAKNAAELESALNGTLAEVEYKFKDLPTEQLEEESKNRLRQVGIWSRFHWPFEFPEVFVDKRGFDAFVGNPPFMGGQKISSNLGDGFRDHLVNHLALGTKGSADLCAYFFLRAMDLLRLDGNMGLLATNTLSQGDTRQVGLDQITQHGAVIYRACPSQVWPGNAAVFVSTCHLHKGRWSGTRHIDDLVVTHISSFLDQEERLAHPHRLAANANLSFMGTQVHGTGFLLTGTEAKQIIEFDPQNKEVIRPYLDGATVNKRPDQSADRWVIDFSGMTEEQATQYPWCFDLIAKRAKPQRLALMGRNASGDSRARLWWRFSREVKELYDAVRHRERVLVIARVSRTGAFVFVSPNQVLNDKLIVITIPHYWGFAVLQSTFHVDWCWTYASTLKGDLNYSQTDCFETFPFPIDRESLSPIGGEYHEVRQHLMETRSEGLTRLYNYFHDMHGASPDIQALRDLHVKMDKAVAAAYGWDDLDLSHGFHETKQGTRFTISESARREVLARLLKLNHERYAEEVAQGLHDKKGKPKAAGRKGKKSSSSEEPILF